MIRLTTSILLLGVVATACSKAPAAEPKVAEAAETRYLTFQLMTGLPGYAGPPPMPGRFALSKSQLEAFVREVVKAIGATGDARHKLGFAVGPLCFDMPDQETRQFIRDSFAVARENDVAVAFHIDDSMSWGRRKDLLSNPDNIETADWKQQPSTGRRADWGPEPTRFPPQMCFNSPAIVAAVKDRAGLIGAEIERELAALKSQGKEHLFAGVIAGWETQIGRDFETGRPLGYRALLHRGFSESHPPRDADLERVRVVKEFMELWANSLHAGGVPRQRIFCHIAFTDQGLRKPDAKESYAVKVNFAPPEVAFSPAYRPGFSTYPEGATFKEIYGVLAKHGSPGWISAEGVNVSPTSMPGEPTMETYLGRMFNHGAVLGERVLLGHRRRGDARQLLPPGHRESRGAGRLRQVPAARDPGRGRSDRFLQRSVPGQDAAHPEGTPGVGAKVGKAGAGDASGTEAPGVHQGQEMAGSGQGGR